MATVAGILRGVTSRMAGRMTRATDPDTSVEAAGRVRPLLSTLQAQVYHAIAAAGLDGLTDRELERLPEFSNRAPSTVRKRRSELYQANLLEPNGVRDRLTVWTARRLPDGSYDATPEPYRTTVDHTLTHHRHD